MINVTLSLTNDKHYYFINDTITLSLTNDYFITDHWPMINTITLSLTNDKHYYFITDQW